MKEHKKVSKKKKEKILAELIQLTTEELKQLTENLMEKRKLMDSVELRKNEEWFERLIPAMKYDQLCAYCEKFVTERNIEGRLGRVFEDHSLVICTVENCPFKSVLRLNIHSSMVQECLKCDEKDNCEFYLMDVKPIVDKEKK